MKILKVALLGSLRFVFFCALKAALIIYILFLPDPPLAGVALEDDGRNTNRAGDPRSNASQEARAIPLTGRPNMEPS